MESQQERSVQNLFDSILGTPDQGVEAVEPGRELDSLGIGVAPSQKKKPVEPTVFTGPDILEKCSVIERFDFSLQTADIRKTQVPEEYRILKTNVQALVERTGNKSMVISSCHHGEGKTTTAIFLARYLARNRHLKVLLIDCDLRRPRIRQMLNLNVTYGIEDVIEGQIPVENAIIYSHQDNLAVLPSRKGHANAPELVEKPRMRALPKELEAHFDFIIIDTPPVLSTTDPTILGAYVGGVILVVKAGATQREAIKYAQSLLAQADCPLRGIVLTQRREYLPRYFHRYRYYYDQYYYRHQEYPDQNK